MGWSYNWTARKADPRDSCRYRAASDDVRCLSSLELRNDKGNRIGKDGNRNRINGGRRGDNRGDDQSGDKGKGNNNNNNNGNGNNNKNNQAIRPFKFNGTAFFIYYNCSLRRASNDNRDSFSDSHLHSHNNNRNINNVNYIYADRRRCYSHKFHDFFYKFSASVIFITSGLLIIHLGDSDDNTSITTIDFKLSREYSSNTELRALRRGQSRHRKYDSLTH
ncbi:hypothetical protein F5883DRAFT_635286 [Diaporthe sp. PMI_573]|nr:hypothetical protein F5883DRAFT_635286 [Diaporthaceae sp. PMI_573]